MIAIQQLTINEVATFKAIIHEALSRKQELSLDLASVTSFDLAGLQTLIAVAHEAASLGRSFSLRGALSDDFRKVLETSGFAAGKVTTGEALTPLLLGV